MTRQYSEHVESRMSPAYFIKDYFWKRYSTPTRPYTANTQATTTAVRHPHKFCPFISPSMIPSRCFLVHVYFGVISTDTRRYRHHILLLFKSTDLSELTYTRWLFDQFGYRSRCLGNTGGVSFIHDQIITFYDYYYYYYLLETISDRFLCVCFLDP
jgi:hypothetical protein